MSKLLQRLRNNRGASLVEYALIVAGCQSAPQSAQVPAQKQNPKCAGRVELGKYGTLKCLRIADGKLPSIYGPTADEPWT